MSARAPHLTLPRRRPKTTAPETGRAAPRGHSDRLEPSQEAPVRLSPIVLALTAALAVAACEEEVDGNTVVIQEPAEGEGEGEDD